MAADRHLCRRAGAGPGRGEGRRRAARPDGHDRRGRRRRAGLRGGRRDPCRPCPTPPIRRCCLNEQLVADLRPTLFLAQLSNLLAGNISIVHGVVGSSRTFMGEEVERRRCRAHRLRPDRSGTGRADPRRRLLQRRAARLPSARRAGQARFGRARAPDLGAPVRGRRTVLGSVGCFLVLESRAHAEARGARPLARLAGVATDRCRRAPGEATANAERQLATFRGMPRRRGNLRRVRRASGDRGGARLARPARAADPGRRDGARAFDGAVVSGHPGAGRDVARPGRAVRAAGGGRGRQHEAGARSRLVRRPHGAIGAARDWRLVEAA